MFRPKLDSYSQLILRIVSYASDCGTLRAAFRIELQWMLERWNYCSFKLHLSGRNGEPG